MIYLLSRYTDRVEKFLKVITQKKKKKIINFTIQRFDKLFSISIRNMCDQKLNDKFYNTKEYVDRYNIIYKEQIENIIDDIDTSKDIKGWQAYFLINSCSVIANCLPIERVKVGEYLLSILNICNFKVHTTHYNALLNLYIKNDYDFSPMQLLLDMESKQLYPDDITYRACIEHYCKKGNIKEALKLIENMKKLQIPVTGCIFNSLAAGYSLLGSMEAVNETMNTMKQIGMKPNAEIYTMVMCIHAKFNSIKEIIKIIETCNSKNIYFTNKDILNVIYTLAVNGHTKYLNVIYQYLREKVDIFDIEIQIILKLANINQIHIVISVLSRICSNSKLQQFENVMTLILKNIIRKNKTISEIARVCGICKEEELFRKYLLISLYYSLSESNDLFIPLLQICKNRCTLKPHYFWPILITEAKKYNMQGILDVLKIMINDFNVFPCIDTVADYVLPFTFGSFDYIRNLLVKCKIDITVIDNAYVSFMLKKQKLSEAAVYIRTFRNQYYYKVMAYDLRVAAISKNDVHNFVYISCNLCVESELKDEQLHISLNKQLCDLMIEFPSHKIWFSKVINQLRSKNISLKYETMTSISKFLHEHPRGTMYTLKYLANKRI